MKTTADKATRATINAIKCFADPCDMSTSPVSSAKRAELVASGLLVKVDGRFVPTNVARSLAGLPIVAVATSAEVEVDDATREQTKGKCSCCKVILVWSEALKIGSITRGEVACSKCGTVLTRTHSRAPERRVLRVPVRA